jgi:hypothetical protein
MKKSVDKSGRVDNNIEFGNNNYTLNNHNQHISANISSCELGGEHGGDDQQQQQREHNAPVNGRQVVVQGRANNTTTAGCCRPPPAGQSALCVL